MSDVSVKIPKVLTQEIMNNSKVISWGYRNASEFIIESTRLRLDEIERRKILTRKPPMDSISNHTPNYQQAHLYSVVLNLKEKRQGQLSNKKLLKLLTNLQEQGRITYSLSFATMEPRRLSTYMSRWKNAYEKQKLSPSLN